MVKSVIRHALEGAGVSLLMCTTLVLALGIPLGIVDTYGVSAFFMGIASGITMGTGLLNLSEHI